MSNTFPRLLLLLLRLLLLLLLLEVAHNMDIQCSCCSCCCRRIILDNWRGIYIYKKKEKGLLLHFATKKPKPIYPKAFLVL